MGEGVGKKVVDATVQIVDVLNAQLVKDDVMNVYPLA